MKTILSYCLCSQIFCLFFYSIGYTQTATPATTKPKAQSSAPGKGLFESDKILEATLSGNIRKLTNDRGDNPKYHDLNFIYRNEDSVEINLPVQAKTRGHFRKLKGNCEYPPLALNFSKSETGASSTFNKQQKLKLVMPCRGDEYIVREWLVYKLYNLVTPKSFRARLIRLTLENAKNKKRDGPFYGILLEEEKQMAKRNEMISFEKKLRPEQTDEETFLTMAVFQYLVGNTDWSIQYLQNIKLIGSDTNAIPIPVAYDFDHSGMVNAPYAHPAAELLMHSVLERRYRGYCITDMKKFDPVIALYNKIKNDIYSLYTNCSLLDEKYIKSTLKYFDEFYETINNPEALQKEFGYPCYKSGTGNVVIKGLKQE